MFSIKKSYKEIEGKKYFNVQTKVLFHEIMKCANFERSCSEYSEYWFLFYDG